VKLWDPLFGGDGRLSKSGAEVLARLGPLLPKTWSLAQLAPSRAERRALPDADVISSGGWDLRRRRPPKYTAIVGSGLELAYDAVRLKSVLASCRLLVALERSHVGHAVETERRVLHLDLGGLELNVYRGDYTEPLLRVDDYPTGVRPILNDLTPLHDVLLRIDRAGMPFHLGIVPGILDDSMLRFLSGLEHLIAAQHGFDHGYPKYSRVLLDKQDPRNQRGTVGAFDEFAGTSYDDQLARLREGRTLLETRLGRRVTSYVPPTNTANRRTGRALEALGFEYVLSERVVPGCSLPSIPSGFYGRSSELPRGPVPDVVTLHATWEVDLLEQGHDSLGPFLAALLAERQRRRDEVERVAERIAFGLGG
jgi:hypothetical protein